MEILAHPTLLSLWVLLLVMLLEHLWQWPEAYHPLTFVRLLAQKMAFKVNPSGKRSEYQQRLSGALGLIVLILPWSIILALFLSLAEYPQFFEGLLLLVALKFQDVLTRCKKIYACLRREKKQLAKDTLQPLLLREAQNLSALGIAKASCETAVLRFSYQYVAVLFWYCLLGGVFALVYRLIYEFSHSWNTKLPQYQYFGQASARLTNLLAWLPIRLTQLLFALAQNFSGTIAGIRSAGRKASSHTLLLASAGGAIDAELSGPAYYLGHKIRNPKVGSTSPMRLQHLAITLQMLLKSKFILAGYAVLYFCTLYAMAI